MLEYLCVVCVTITINILIERPILHATIYFWCEIIPGDITIGYYVLHFQNAQNPCLKPCHFLACLAQSLPAWPYPCLLGPILACLALSLPAWPYPCLLGPILACLALSLPAWPYPCLLGPILACLALSLPAWPYPCLLGPILACLALSLP